MINPKRVKIIKFNKAIMQGKTQRQAAVIAGFKDSSSTDARASQFAKLPEVRRNLERALDRANATLDKSAVVIARAHEAKIVKVFNDESGIKYSKPLVDHNTRLKAAELNLKARGLLNSSEVPDGQIVGFGFLLLKNLHARGLDNLIDGETV